MKIALLTLGTLGDAQPFVALGKALKARGHDVVLGAPENFQSWIEGHGLAYRSIGAIGRPSCSPQKLARSWPVTCSPWLGCGAKPSFR